MHSTFVEEHRCGEGYNAQNSRTLLIGVGEILKLDLTRGKMAVGA